MASPYEPELEEDPMAAAPAAAAGAKGGGGGAGGLSSLMGGGTNVISNVAQTAMKIYQAKLERERRERERKDALERLARKGMDSAAKLGADSSIHNTNTMSQAFLRNLL